MVEPAGAIFDPHGGAADGFLVSAAAADRRFRVGDERVVGFVADVAVADGEGGGLEERV